MMIEKPKKDLDSLVKLDSLVNFLNKYVDDVHDYEEDSTIKYLYHLTTENRLKSILKDMKLIPKIEGCVFFADNIEKCKIYAPVISGDMLSQNDYKKLENSIYKFLLSPFNNVLKRKNIIKFPVIKIPLEWLDKRLLMIRTGKLMTLLTKNIPINYEGELCEYMYKGEVLLPEIPEIEWVEYEEEYIDYSNIKRR